MKDAEPPKTLAVALRDGLTVDLAVQRSECFDVVPTSVDLFYAERLLNTLPGRELRLRRVIEKLAPGYQYVLIDCPPTLGYLTDNALVAAGWVLVPLKAQDSSVESANMLLGQVSVLRETLGVPIEVLGLVVNELDDTNLSKTILEAIPEELPEHPVLASIRRRVRIAEAWRAGKPITELEPWGDAADAFRTLAQAVVDRCDEIARVHTHA